MKSVHLHIALHDVVEKFGCNILCEDRLINILLDYGAFANNPAIKNILKTMIANDYCRKILDLGKRKRFSLSVLLNQPNKLEKPQGEDWKTKVQSHCVDFARQNGYLQDLVVYATESILYALSWKTNEPNNIVASKNNTISKSSSSMSSGQSVVSNVNITSKASGTNTNLTNSITYQSISNTQFLVINVKPLNAEVYVDGKQEYVSNGVSAVELTVGKHDYEVRANSHETQKGTIDINASSKQSLDIVLKVQQTLANLSIECIDADTEIWENGKIIGIGTWSGLVKVGSLSIECRKDKCYPYTVTQTISGGKNNSIKIPTLQPMCGNLKVNVQPYGSKIFINGKEEGTTPLMVTGIQIGERMLRVLTSEGQDYVTTVDIKENKVTDVNHVIPSLFLDDYSQLKVGDWYYEDGTFSHVKADGKTAVGIVFSLVTSEEEKRFGWTHGQIIALSNAPHWELYGNKDERSRSWGIYNPYFKQYSIQKPEEIQVSDYNRYNCGYHIANLDFVKDNVDYPQFYIASRYKSKLPTHTSGWYLPCLAQCMMLYQEIWNLHNYYEIQRDILHLSFTLEMSTSTICDENKAWLFRPDTTDKRFCYRKCKLDSGWFYVRPVASF